MNENTISSTWVSGAAAIQATSPVTEGAVLQATSVYSSVSEERQIQRYQRGQAILDWLYGNKENDAWYEANRDNLHFKEDCIEILWDKFELEDESAEANGVDVWNIEWNSYFTFEAAQKYAESKGKTIPANWSKYTDFLPGDDDNKIRFLRDVLGLRFAGSQDSNDGTISHNGTQGYYWTSSKNSVFGYHLAFSHKSLYPNEYNLRQFGYTVRCIKNKQ